MSKFSHALTIVVQRRDDLGAAAEEFLCRST